MEQAIKTICYALREKAEAVISYCEKLERVSTLDNAYDTAQLLERIRLDEVEHIQNLTLQLTNLIVPGLEKPPNEKEV